MQETGVLVDSCHQMWRDSHSGSFVTNSPTSENPQHLVVFISFVSCMRVNKVLVFPALGPQASRSQDPALFTPTSPADQDAELAQVSTAVITEVMISISISPATSLARWAPCPSAYIISSSNPLSLSYYPYLTGQGSTGGRRKVTCL